MGLVSGWYVMFEFDICRLIGVFHCGSEWFERRREGMDNMKFLHITQGQYEDFDAFLGKKLYFYWCKKPSAKAKIRIFYLTEGKLAHKK